MHFQLDAIVIFLSLCERVCVIRCIELAISIHLLQKLFEYSFGAVFCVCVAFITGQRCRRRRCHHRITIYAFAYKTLL